MCVPSLLRGWAPAFLRLSWFICEMVSIAWGCLQNTGEHAVKHEHFLTGDTPGTLSALVVCGFMSLLHMSDAEDAPPGHLLSWVG